MEIVFSSSSSSNRSLLSRINVQDLYLKYLSMCLVEYIFVYYFNLLSIVQYYTLWVHVLCS